MTMPNTAALLAARRRKRSFYPVEIKNSILLDGSLSSRLSRSYSVLDDSTISVWVKRGTLGAVQPILGTILYFDTDDTLRAWGAKTVAVFRDCTAWYHISASNTGIYVNGVYQDMSIGISATAFSNAQVGFDGASTYFSGYLAEFILTSGVRNGGSSFGQLKKGAWIPKKYTGSYGAAGFKLEFADAGQLGLDTSGNGNSFSVNGSPVQSSDNPTNNYCTINPVDASLTGTSVAISSANLDMAASAYVSSNYATRGLTMPFGGKKYFEARFRKNSTYANFVQLLIGSFGIHWGKDYDSQFRVCDAVQSVMMTDDDWVGAAVDFDAGKAWVKFNGGAWLGGGDPVAGTNPTGAWTPVGGPLYSGQAAVGASNDNTHKGRIMLRFDPLAWAGSAPSGFKPVCSKYLPEPSVIDGREGFETVLWTGDGSGARSLSTTMSSPDLFWNKCRSGPNGSTWHHIMDNVRGANRVLYPNSVAAEASSDLVSFDANGVTVAGPRNQSGDGWVGWLWRKGAKYGVDILTPGAQAGPGTFSVAHDLGAKPELIILKSRTSSTRNWFVTHKDLGASMSNYSLNLNTTSSAAASGVWGGEPTSTHMYYVVDNTNGCVSQGGAPVIYLFRSVPGFSKVFSYTGNGSADGPFVELGFRPAFVMIKHTTASDYWEIIDSARDGNNPAYHRLYPNSPLAEATNKPLLDFISSGFKLRVGDVTEINASGDTYVGIAFAANPFKYANAV